MRRELSSVCWIAAQSLEPGHTVSTPWSHFKVKRVKVALKEKEKWGRPSLDVGRFYIFPNKILVRSCMSRAAVKIFLGGEREEETIREQNCATVKSCGIRVMPVPPLWSPHNIWYYLASPMSHQLCCGDSWSFVTLQSHSHVQPPQAPMMLMIFFSWPTFQNCFLMLKVCHQQQQTVDMDRCDTCWWLLLLHCLRLALTSRGL